MQVWFHELGKPAANDRYEMGKDLPRIGMIRLEADRRGRVLASVQKGDGGEFRHDLRSRRHLAPARRLPPQLVEGRRHGSTRSRP
jgi:hypothetical protein